MRTKNSFLNMLTNLIPSLILPVLSLIKLSWLLKIYGIEIYGMNMYLVQIMGYLSLVEGGFGFCFVQALFKPLAQNNRQKVCELYNGAKFILKIIGSIILVLGLIVLIILPITLKSNLNFDFVRMVFLLMLLPTVIDYYLMAPSCIIQADQKEYILNIIRKSIQIMRVLTHLFIIYHHYHYYFIALSEGLYIIIQALLARYFTLRKYPWLINKHKRDLSTLENAKAVFAHRLAGVVLNSTDTILLGIFIGTVANAIYGNYIYIIGELQKIIESIINAPRASLGHLFVLDKDKSYGVFKEYFYFTNFVASIICIPLAIVMNNFISLWQDSKVVLGDFDAFLFSGILYFILVRQPIMNVRDTNGLFKESKKYAYLEAIFNFIFSIIGIYYFGIRGALLVTFFTYLVSTLIMNARLVYRVVFKLPIISYYKIYFTNTLISLGLGLTSYYLWHNFIKIYITNLVSWFIISSVLFILLFGLIFIIYYKCFKDFRIFIERLKKLLNRRLRKGN